MIDIPIKFPSDADVNAEEAARFRALSPRERVRVILDMVSTGDWMMRKSPKLDFMLQYKREQEELAQQSVKDFIRRHG
jgi:hypothetical protein